MRKARLLLAAALVCFAPLSVQAQDDAASKPMPDAERAQVEAVIKDYLINKHPEVLVDAMQELQRRDQASAENKTKQAISGAKDKIFNDPNTPVLGNPKGNVTVVEFYDYQCGYCKMSQNAMERLLKDDKNLRVVYKDFPILGPLSVTASKASFASIKQGKFQKFHDALMDKKDHLNEDTLYQTAKEVGLDVDQLKKDMADASIQKQIDDNLKLGNDTGVRGTPMFIINNEVYPGALDYDQLKKAIDNARAANKG
jgi:protein-disulfide isomerase